MCHVRRPTWHTLLSQQVGPPCKPISPVHSCSPLPLTRSSRRLPPPLPRRRHVLPSVPAGPHAPPWPTPPRRARSWSCPPSLARFAAPVLPRDPRRGLSRRPALAARSRERSIGGAGAPGGEETRFLRFAAAGGGIRASTTVSAVAGLSVFL